MVCFGHMHRIVKPLHHTNNLLLRPKAFTHQCVVIYKAFAVTQMIPTRSSWCSLNDVMADWNSCMLRLLIPSSPVCRAEKKSVVTRRLKCYQRRNMRFSNTRFHPKQVMLWSMLALSIRPPLCTVVKERWFRTRHIVFGTKLSLGSGLTHRCHLWKDPFVKFGSTPGAMIHKLHWCVMFHQAFFWQKPVKKPTINSSGNEFRLWILPRCSGFL